MDWIMPEHHGLGRNPHPLTPEAAALFPITRQADYRASTSTYKYWYQNGSWLDQGQEGTCVGHAFAHRRSDAPVKTEGITHQWARELYYEASGDGTYQKGTSGYAACRVLMDRGTISAYHWVSTPEEMKNTLLTVGSVCIGIDWFNSMFYPVPKYSNQYLTVDPTSGLAGGHEVVINGLNLNPVYGKPYYRLKNSWGTSWGYNGTVRVLVDDLNNLLFNRGGDAVVITEKK